MSKRRQSKAEPGQQLAADVGETIIKGRQTSFEDLPEEALLMVLELLLFPDKQSASLGGCRNVLYRAVGLCWAGGGMGGWGLSGPCLQCELDPPWLVTQHKAYAQPGRPMPLQYAGVGKPSSTSCACGRCGTMSQSVLPWQLQLQETQSCLTTVCTRCAAASLICCGCRVSLTHLGPFPACSASPPPTRLPCKARQASVLMAGLPLTLPLG